MNLNTNYGILLKINRFHDTYISDYLGKNSNMVYSVTTLTLCDPYS